MPHRTSLRGLPAHDSAPSRKRVAPRTGLALLPIALPAVLSFAAHASATITPISEFTGDPGENFNEFSNVIAVQSLPVFNNTATLNNLTSGGAIKVEFSSSLNGTLVVPRSGMMGGQLGIGSWAFDQPIMRFGGWWANNSGQPDATVDFYDAANNLVGSATATVPFAPLTWTWNGWRSDTPVSRIQVTGNGLINGFIWYDDMQITYVPEPPTCAALAGLALLAARRPTSSRWRRRPAGIGRFPAAVQDSPASK